MATVTPGGHGLGMIRGLGDIRDYRFAAPPAAAPALPSVDLRPRMPPIGDQGQLGSCTAWASTAAYRYELDRQQLADFEPSELFQYYRSREIMGRQYLKVDSGAEIRDAVKALAKYGACPEALWPYDISKFAKAPPAKATRAAKPHLVLQYQAVDPTAAAIESALASALPVVIGISIYASFESDEVARTGVVPMPSTTEQLLGGHAVLIVGYDRQASRFTVRNSWGPGWGDQGYFYLPYEYVLNAQLASDFWVLAKVE
jgi:C1A family cysteine protease